MARLYWAAATNGHEEVMQLLIENGADINLGAGFDGLPLVGASVGRPRKSG